MNEHYDVLIIGGGMVGAAIACSLGGSRLRVAVIEEAMPQAFSPEQEHDLRVSALSIASKNVLDMAGAWKPLVAMRVCPYKRMKVWENAGEVEFRSDDVREDALGYIVENRLVQLALLQQLPRHENVVFHCPVSIRRVDYRAEGSTVELADGRLLTCRLLVAADGGQSATRRAAGLGVHNWDYEHHAFVLSVETAYPQQDITWQRFTPRGPLAFLPMPGPHASLVWYESPNEIKRLSALSEADLLQTLKDTFPPSLGEIKRVLAKGSFPLRRQHAQHYVAEGVALAGDAAHMIHPLAGQGVNIGLLDAAALAQVLVEARAKGQDIGSLKTLRAYERMRRQDNLLMMTAMDVFYRVFGTASAPVTVLRNLGLGLAERLPFAKKRVMRHAMGLEGDLPRLARGEPLLT